MSYKKIRALDRGLQVLAHLNSVKSATPNAIAIALRLPLPTVYRILETLEDGEFVARGLTDNVFRVTIKVRRLSEGYRDENWVIAVAAPILEELSREVVWPTDLATFDGQAMVIRECTHKTSPLSINPGMVGVRLSMMRSSVGRAYLAFCPDRERDAIIETLQSSPDPNEIGARDLKVVRQLVATTRERGFALRDREVNPKITSIALPVMHAGRVQACVTVVWIASALTFAEGVKRCLPPLREAIAHIQENLALASEGKS